MVVEFYTLPDAPSIWPGLGPGRQVSTNSSTDECVSLARKWLQGCLSSHPECRRPEPSEPQLPTRVVAVGSCDEETRVVVTKPGDRGEYAALSHCWGGAHPTVLLSSNLEALQAKLNFDTSSNTFREAVSFTRRLGIPYLWIDSLCILQDKDDLSDWEREAPKMSSVYNSATVTLSAASSSDTSGGLFPSQGIREPRQRIVHSLVEPEAPHLRARAWVLQEDQLSPRMLHFRKEELAWTCSSCSRCECRIRPDDDKPYRSRMFCLQWPTMVMDYTRRSLTRERDRIAALSGLAGYIERCTTDTFFCGLFYEDISFQLLWYIDRDAHPPRQDPPQARFSAPYAPSWSWMSVPGPISY
ncbi:heterokaryon incompatibility protein-domain-containing protein, partial [Cercophora newfieldiana]